MKDLAAFIAENVAILKTAAVGGAGALVSALIMENPTLMQVLTRVLVGVFVAVTFTNVVIFFVPSMKDIETAIAAVLGITGREFVGFVSRKAKDGSLLEFLAKVKK